MILLCFFKIFVYKKTGEIWWVLVCYAVTLQVLHYAYTHPNSSTTHHFQSQYKLSQQLKCNRPTLLASKWNAQQGRIHPVAEELIEMQDATF